MNTYENYPYNQIASFDHFRAFVDGMADLYGADKTAYVEYTADGREQSYSFQALADDVNAFGAALCSLDLRGKHVAIVGENRYRWLVALLGVISTGGVAVTIDIEQTEDTIWNMVTRADASAVVYSGTFAPFFAARLPVNDTPMLGIAMSGQPASGHRVFCELLAYGKLQLCSGTVDLQRIPIDPDQTAMIVFTSGTTSFSKAVMLTHRNLMFNATHGSAMLYMGERIFTSLPLYHTYGLTCAVLNQLSQGHTMCVNGDIKTMMGDIKRFNPDCMVVVPLIAETMLARIRAELKKRGQLDKCEPVVSCKPAVKSYPGLYEAARPIIDEMFGHRLVRMVSGGAHLNADVQELLGAMGIEVFQGYGITECSPLVSVNRNLANRIGSIGFLLPETEVRFEDGEIWVKGPSVSPGYYKSPELTRASYEDGWFKTGDIGTMDRNGFLYISSRKKNLIVFKNGKKVAPEEIEQQVQSIPMIKEAMAYGAATGQSADDVKLVLLVYPDPELTKDMSSYEVLQALQAEIDEVNSSLPAYKQIQTIRLRDTEFQKTATKKIKRYIV